MTNRDHYRVLGLAVVLAACSGDGGSSSQFGPEGGEDASGGAGASGTGPGASSGGGGGDSGGGIKYDVGGGATGADPEGGGSDPDCIVSDDLDAPGPCGEKAPPDSFDPDIQWEFGPFESSFVTPLVANFTDDDGNGEIDLCDTPDILLVAKKHDQPLRSCRMYLLDGATGVVHFVIGEEEMIECQSTPAIGDIDNDGLVEIVALYDAGEAPEMFGEDTRRYELKAFEHDGTVKWANKGNHEDNPSVCYAGRLTTCQQTASIALHDLDADGDVEILFNHAVYDHEGTRLWQHKNPDAAQAESSVGVDLDGDGKMEVLVGYAAFRWDGSVYFNNYPQVSSRSIPNVGNLDDDPEPEIFVTADQGLWMLEHDGSIKYGPVTPTGVPPDTVDWRVWQRPATIHDFDGDQKSEWASSSRHFYAVYKGPDPADILWKAEVEDISGVAAGTAFDFLGDGIAEAMYADEKHMFIYDGQTGDVLLRTERKSATIVELPTVVDVDNDGSAEILVVSEVPQPALQVIRDRQDRWVPARRIWNQHAYYVTNVYEDGTIPRDPINNWETLNTFRTQAQIEPSGEVCEPEPQG